MEIKLQSVIKFLSVINVQSMNSNLQFYRVSTQANTNISIFHCANIGRGYYTSTTILYLQFETDLKT